jgi:hypothetical protein
MCFKSGEMAVVCWAVVDAWVGRHAREAGKEVGQVALALYENLQAVRGDSLERAAAARTADGNHSYVEAALAALELQVALYRSGLESVGYEFFKSAAAREMLISRTIEWAHFLVNAADREARECERQAIVRCVEAGIPSAEELLTRLRPWEERTIERHNKEFRDIAGPAVAKAEAIVAGYIIEKLDMDGGMRELFSSESGAARHVISKIPRPLWSAPLLSELTANLMKAESDPIIHENAYYLLELLTFSSDGAYWPLRRDTAEKLAKEYRDVLKAIWDASVARVIQFRMQHDAAKCRERLIQLGLTEAELPLPDWWVTEEEYKALTGRLP